MNKNAYININLNLNEEYFVNQAKILAQVPISSIDRPQGHLLKSINLFAMHKFH